MCNSCKKDTLIYNIFERLPYGIKLGDLNTIVDEVERRAGIRLSEGDKNYLKFLSY